MSKNQKKSLTYEEIARKYDITTAKAHSIVKSAYNKMIIAIMSSENMNIFESVLVIREYFNMSEQEAYEKLNDEHKELIRLYAVKEYGIKGS
jgi:DNA-binding transcriptional regulator LsrR (DeoR family)